METFSELTSQCVYSKRVTKFSLVYKGMDVEGTYTEDIDREYVEIELDTDLTDLDYNVIEKYVINNINC